MDKTSSQTVVGQNSAVNGYTSVEGVCYRYDCNEKGSDLHFLLLFLFFKDSDKRIFLLIVIFIHIIFIRMLM